MKSTADKIGELKDKLSHIDTEALLYAISRNYYTFTNEKGIIERDLPFQFTSELMSPQKQSLYLAGLIMSTDQLESNAVGIEIKDIENAIQDITSSYIRGFFLTDRMDIRSEEFRELISRRMVSMSAFVSYFDTGILRYEEQTYDLIKTLYSDFDNELVDITGLELSDYLEFYDFIKAELDSINLRMIQVKEKIRAFLEGLDTSSKNIDAEYQRMIDYLKNHPEEMQLIQEGLCRINKIEKKAIIDHFGADKSKILLEQFSLERKHRDFTYYNEDNPFSRSPLCWLDENRLFLVSPQILLNSIYSFITATIEDKNNNFVEKYKKRKAQIVENEFIKCFQSIFGDKATYHCAVCESIGTQEHDIVIEYKDVILIAEVKASKVHEPFFTPEKSYERIKRHFNSKSGIGYAYLQAIKLRNKIKSSNCITLYENMKDEFQIDNLKNKTIVPVVLTLEQFGIIAINTSTLIHPVAGDPYPWVCDLHDFQNLIEMLDYLKEGADSFVDYVLWRSEKHEKIQAGDELDIVEWFFANPGYRNVDRDIIIKNNMEDSLIDRIYFKKKGLTLSGEDSYTYFNIDNALSVNSKTVYKGKKIYPNEPCPCGSGMKYKKCHGRKIG